MTTSAPQKGIQVAKLAGHSCRPVSPGTGTAISVDAADQETYS